MRKYQWFWMKQSSHAGEMLLLCLFVFLSPIPAWLRHYAVIKPTKPKNQKTKKPKKQKTKKTKNQSFLNLLCVATRSLGSQNIGFLVFWFFGFLVFWSFGFLVFWVHWLRSRGSLRIAVAVRAMSHCFSWLLVAAASIGSQWATKVSPGLRSARRRGC